MTLSLIPGTYNTRDVGGIPLEGGGEIRPGVLLRADGLGAVPPEGVRRMAELGITVVADLRTAAERETLPDRLPDGTRVLELPLLEGALTALPVAAEDEELGAGVGDAAAADRPEIPEMRDVYTQMIGHEQTAQALAAIAREVAAIPEGQAVLVHCTAGKDRTGVAFAVILEAVGAERGAIVDDYSRSGEMLAGPWAEQTMAVLIAYGAPDSPVLRRLVTESPREIIEETLDLIAKQHGGAAEYLRSGGMSDTELVALRARLRG